MSVFEVEVDERVRVEEDRWILERLKQLPVKQTEIVEWHG